MRKSVEIFAVNVRRTPCASQEEYDAFTGWRHLLPWKPGERKLIKRKYHRRWRKQARQWAQLQRLQDESL